MRFRLELAFKTGAGVESWVDAGVSAGLGEVGFELGFGLGSCVSWIWRLRKECECDAQAAELQRAGRRVAYAPTVAHRPAQIETELRRYGRYAHCIRSNVAF